jgi:ribA/ribD-fused uncharacterized protein
VITEFRGEYRFLSNFYELPVFYQHPDMQGAIWWPTAEHAFQASKSSQPSEVKRILEAGSPRDAKQLGRQATCRDDWEQMKKRVMFSVLLAKFAPDYIDLSTHQLAAQLVATAPHVLVEGNTWGDDYWGAVPGMQGNVTLSQHWTPDLAGHNYLGRLLMAVRDILE